MNLTNGGMQTVDTAPKNKWRGHPLQDRVDRGEIKLVDYLDVPKEVLLSRIANLDPMEQDVIIWAWERRGQFPMINEKKAV